MAVEITQSKAGACLNPGELTGHLAPAPSLSLSPPVQGVDWPPRTLQTQLGHWGHEVSHADLGPAQELAVESSSGLCSNTALWVGLKISCQSSSPSGGAGG